MLTATTPGGTFGTVGKVNVNNLGLFFQDAWTVNNRLTINAGLRTERENIPSYRANLNGINFSFADKLAPRLGVAYDSSATASGRPTAPGACSTTP